MGQHKCIAEHLSLFQLTAIIATINQRFQIDLEGGGSNPERARKWVSILGMAFAWARRLV